MFDGTTIGSMAERSFSHRNDSPRARRNNAIDGIERASIVGPANSVSRLLDRPVTELESSRVEYVHGCDGANLTIASAFRVPTWQPLTASARLLDSS